MAGSPNGPAPAPVPAAQSGQPAQAGQPAQTAQRAPADQPAQTAPVLRASGLSLRYDSRLVVEGLDLELPPGAVTAVVGANACGKSTLLRGLARLLGPAAGTVTLDGDPLASIGDRALARRLGVLPQQPTAPDGISVRELVMRGRYPHRPEGIVGRWFGGSSAADETAVDAALAATGTADLAGRGIEELSGGQRQRVWIAMALAQETEVLLLDEPTTFLDLAHQVEVLDLIRELNAARGVTVAAVLHDLNLAARYADHVVAMKAGAIVAQGRPADVFTEGLVAEVFGLEARVVPDPVAGTPLIVPLGRHMPQAGSGHSAGEGDVKYETTPLRNAGTPA
ncbi:ABC transporter ATP-binding protein [Sinomonas halotolerans]|uniref:ABC transporter ATP-binding protein n=1 Tax=Sinomonas halotolerans TaxID=1644133 RepID=A0ABU9X159_9MICC